MAENARYILVTTAATNMVPDDDNVFCDADWDGMPENCTDVFLVDRDADEDGIFDEPGATTTTLTSVSSQGEQGNGWTYGVGLSSEGRFVLLYSLASNLVPGDTNNNIDLFVRDLWTGTTQAASILPGADRPSGALWGSMSDDGRFVSFDFGGVWVRDLVTGQTALGARAMDGGKPNSTTHGGILSGNGEYLAFNSYATNLVPNDNNGVQDAFIAGRMRCPIGGFPEGPVSAPIQHTVEPIAGQAEAGGVVHTANCAAVVPAGL